MKQQLLAGVGVGVWAAATKPNKSTPASGATRKTKQRVQLKKKMVNFTAYPFPPHCHGLREHRVGVPTPQDVGCVCMSPTPVL
jgi:hypothetical protein